MKLAQDKD